MKTGILRTAILVGISVMMFSSVAHAATTDDAIRIKIQELRAMIQAMKDKAALLSTQTKNTSTKASSTSTTQKSTQSDTIHLTRDLSYRSKDSDTNGEVSDLQDFLQAKGYLSANPTGYFGILTLNAVKAFQKDNGINPTGFVGPQTRDKVNSIAASMESGSGSVAPPITSGSPESPPGTSLAAAGPTKEYKCGTKFSRIGGDANEGYKAINRIQKESAQKDVTNPLPKTSAGISPRRGVREELVDNGSTAIIYCYVYGFGGTPNALQVDPVGMPWSYNLPNNPSPTSWENNPNESAAQRFNRLSKLFCRDNAWNFPYNGSIVGCAKAYGDTTLEIAKANPLPIPTKQEIESHADKLFVSEHELDLVMQTITDRYGKYSCALPAAQMISEHEADLRQYPLGGAAPADPEYVVGKYENFSVDYSRLNRCTITYLAAKELNRLNPYITDKAVPSIMLGNADTYETQKRALLETPGPTGTTYADTFYTIWDPSQTKRVDWYQDHFIIPGKTTLFNYCSSKKPRENLFDTAIAGGTMKTKNSSGISSCDALKWECAGYETVQCQQNYPSKYCGLNFQTTWDKYCK